MAEALIARLVATICCEPDQIWATDPVAQRCDTLKRLHGVRVGSSNRDAAAWAGIIVLAVKPQILDGVMNDIAGELKRALTISVAAGIPIQAITKAGGTGTECVRAMPNTPAMVQEGMTALAIGPGVSESGGTEIARTIFESVGKVVTVEERLMDAVTGLSGSGPAYVFLAIEAMADGGVKMGLPRATAEVLAAQTVLGAAKMVIETGEHPARLRTKWRLQAERRLPVCIVSKSGGCARRSCDAIEAATKRSQELGR